MTVVPHGSVWTDARCELLRTLWHDGLSAAQCACELGGDISRNAVISKAHRLHLEKRAPRAPRVHESPPSPLLTAEIERGGVTLFELTEESCRWPIGTPGQSNFFFCGDLGADLMHGRPYCGGQECCRFSTTTGQPRQ